MKWEEGSRHSHRSRKGVPPDRPRSVGPTFGGGARYVEILNRILESVEAHHTTTDELVCWHRGSFTNASIRDSIMRRTGHLEQVGRGCISPRPLMPPPRQAGPVPVIVSGDGIRSGDPRIDGTRTTVLDVRQRVIDDGEDPHLVAGEYEVSVPDVFYALAYCCDHREEFARRENEADTARREGEQRTRELLERVAGDDAEPTERADEPTERAD